MIGKVPFQEEVNFAFEPLGVWVRAGRLELSTDSRTKLLETAAAFSSRGYRVYLEIGLSGFTAYGEGGLDGLEISMKMDTRQE